MARTTSTATPGPCAAGRPEPGLTKRQAGVCLLQPPPGGPVKGGSKRQTHDQAEPHSAEKQTVAKGPSQPINSTPARKHYVIDIQQ